MKVSLITPWDNAWVPMFRAEIERRGHIFTDTVYDADVCLHGWCHSKFGGPPVKGAKNIYFMRRFELFSGGLQSLGLSLVDHIICCNEWIADVTRQTLKRMDVKVPVSLVYNAVDLSKWTPQKRESMSYKIGMACHVHPKKNLPLALQILDKLPEHSLHIAGEVQDPCTAEYLNHLAKSVRRKVYLYGHIPREELNLWWEQMDCCLSTSISEGNPNNVLEAMAKGIQPVVHAWPGADRQFPEVFTTVDEAVTSIVLGSNDDYRAYVEEHYSLKNIGKALDIAGVT